MCHSDIIKCFLFLNYLMVDVDAMSFLSQEKKNHSVLFEVCVYIYIYVTHWFNFFKILKYF